MTKVTLMEAIREGHLKIGDKVRLHGSILPHYPVSFVESSQSGYEEGQSITRYNTNFYYLGIENDGAIRFVKSRATESRLILRGEKGFENGLHIMHKICSDLFSTKSLGIFSTPMTHEEFMKYCNREETKPIVSKIMMTAESFLATKHVRINPFAEKGTLPISYGFNTLIAYVELMEGNIEKTGVVGILPTIKMYLPELVYFYKDKEELPNLISKQKADNC